MHFQIGFNRRYAADFQAAKKDLAAGIAGEPQLLRSLTRDPGTGSIGHAARIPAWTIFLETLIHDFDTLNWFNEGAEPVEVYAVADALVEPGLRDQGFLDTAVVTIRYSNGAIAVAEANFSALYGYDIRGEVFGSKGMVQAGRASETAARRFTAEGMSADTPRLNVELFRQAYTDELVDFADAVRARRDAHRAGGEALQPHPGSQRRPARAGYGAGLHRVGQAGHPGGRQRSGGPVMRLAVCAEMVFTDLPFTERVRRIHEAGFDVELWDSRTKDISGLKATGAVFSSMTGYTSGSLVDPDTADDVVRTAESLIPYRPGAWRQPAGGPPGGTRRRPRGPAGLPLQRPHVDHRRPDPGTAREARCEARGDVLPREPQHRSWTTPASRWPGPRTPWRWCRPPGTRTPDSCWISTTPKWGRGT